MSQALKIYHDLADIIVKPTGKVNQTRLKKMLCSTLDQYLDEDHVAASVIHNEANLRYGNYYRTPGYYLRLYRQRMGLTQVELANKVNIHQHHLSEMENNKRILGKVNAKKLASILNCDYHKFL